MSDDVASSSQIRLWRDIPAKSNSVGVTSTSVVRSTAIQPSIMSSLVPNSICLDPVTTSTAVYAEAPKSAESRRQIQRLIDALQYRVDSGAQEQASLSDERIIAAIKLLQNFISSPIDIPVASIDVDGNPSLFIFNDDIYADLTFDGSFAEYYLRLNADGQKIERFDREAVDGTRIPTRLFGSLIQVLKNK